MIIWISMKHQSTLNEKNNWFSILIFASVSIHNDDDDDDDDG